MKKCMTLFLPFYLFWSYSLFYPATAAFAETAASYNAVPPFISRGSDPNVLLNLSIEEPMGGAAYNDQRNDSNGDGDTSDLNECNGRNGDYGICYFKTQKYFGIFDPKKAYDYDSSHNRFIPVGTTDENYETSGHYSGNFLNWATMTAIDEFRVALTGGNRFTDDKTETVLERANIVEAYFQKKMITQSDNVHPRTVTPSTDSEIYIYNHGTQVDIGGAHNLDVRVKVCDPSSGLEDNCVSYDHGAYYKPEGLIQKNAKRMRFAVMSYTMDGSQERDGGVLRSKMKYVGSLLPDGTANSKAEYDKDGIYLFDPDKYSSGNNTVDSGVINFINKFGKNGYKVHDPVSELFYECLKYYKNEKPTPEYANGLTEKQKDGFPVITEWEDPIQHWCQPNYIVAINDANPWLDKKLPGTHFKLDWPSTRKSRTGWWQYWVQPPSGSSPPWGWWQGQQWGWPAGWGWGWWGTKDVSYNTNDFGEPGEPDKDIDVTTLTNTVGELQGINGTTRCVGYTDENWDGQDTYKRIPALGEVMGPCPGAGKQNSYYIAGLAYYANTQDIRPDLDKRQTVSTFMIDTQEYQQHPNVGEMNMLWLAGKYGGFQEKDSPDPENKNPKNVGNQFQPNLSEEWDADGDGEPDNYVLATNPEKLINGLTKAFSEINKRSTSGTAASVISGSRSGEGAIYQSVFFPEYQDKASPRANKITWAGSVHAFFVDALGRMREDTPDSASGVQNHILDKKDKVIVFKKDRSTNTLSVEKYSLVDGVAEVTQITLPAASLSLAGKYFLLNTIGEKFYVWFTVGGSGSDPRPAHDRTGIPVALGSNDTASKVAYTTGKALAAYKGAFYKVGYLRDDPTVIQITNKIPGDVEDASPGKDSGVKIYVTRQGVGEKDGPVSSPGNAEDIHYLWNSNTWLNSITATDITTQRSYTSPEKKRYIFTFIDADQDKIADDGETQDFASPSLPTTAQLVDPATIYPYIPVNSDSETLPTGVTVSNRDEFLQKQTQRVINYTRGQDQGAEAISNATLPAFRSRKLDLDNNGSLETTWRLGDIVNSSPTVVDKPMEALHLLYKDTSYGTFAAHYQKRRTVVYTGANDGMMHAFNGGFYEDRFDVYPPVHDKIKDVQFLFQPKCKEGAPMTDVAAHPLGAELWAYVPYNLLPHLYWPTEPSYAHVYFVDLKPRIFDAKIFFKDDGSPLDDDHPGGWGTVLVGGMRFGGGKIKVDMNRNRRDKDVKSDERTMSSAYFILDITNPEKPPTVLGEINFPHLGYTTCYPTVAAMKDEVEKKDSPNRWFLIFGSGPAEADGSPGTTAGDSLPDAVSKQKAELYVVDLVEMVKYKVLKTVSSDGTLTTIPAKSPQTDYYMKFNKDNDAFISDPITVDFDLDYKADAVYFGTSSYYDKDALKGAKYGGKLRRIVMDDFIDPASWVGDSTLLDLESDGVYQSITAAPSVGVDPAGNNWVFFGTGRYFVRDDRYIADQQTFYGIKEPKKVDDSLVNSYAEVSRNALYDSTLIQVNADTKLVKGGPSPPSGTTEEPKIWKDFVRDSKAFAGWYYNFPERERNIGQAALFGDLLTFTSYQPSDDICAYNGSSWLYALYYLTGTAPSRSVIRDVITKSDRDQDNNYLKKIFLGDGLFSKTSIHVGRKDGSTIFVQNSDGGIFPQEVNNPGQTKSGRTAWGYKE